MHNNVIEAVIITGQDTGKTVFIPRIPFVPSDSTVPFKRKQFPLKVSFAMTINKAQVNFFNCAAVLLRIRKCQNLFPPRDKHFAKLVSTLKTPALATAKCTLGARVWELVRG